MPKGLQGFQKGHKRFAGVLFKKGEHSSPKTEFKKGRKGDKNESHPQWKGDEVGIPGIHTWLRVNFGRPNKCEQKNCEGKSSRFEWAKLRDKEYERKRENFWMLCVSCHKKYDYSDERKRKLSNSLKKAWKKRKLNGL